MVEGLGRNAHRTQTSNRMTNYALLDCAHEYMGRAHIALALLSRIGPRRMKVNLLIDLVNGQ